MTENSCTSDSSNYSFVISKEIIILILTNKGPFIKCKLKCMKGNKYVSQKDTVFPPKKFKKYDHIT